MLLKLYSRRARERMETTTDSNGRTFSIIEKKALKFTDTKSNKFWQCALAKHENPKTAEEKAKQWVVILSWGKVGTVGQKQENAYTREHSAKAYMEQRFRDKTRKGYIETNEPELKSNKKAEPKAGLTKFVDTEWDLF